MKVLCPQCRKVEIEWKGNPFRPFCSERCKTIDLGDWASEKFGVPVHEYDSSKEDLESENQNDDGNEDD